MIRIDIENRGVGRGAGAHEGSTIIVTAHMTVIIVSEIGTVTETISQEASEKGHAVGASALTRHLKTLSNQILWLAQIICLSIRF